MANLHCIWVFDLESGAELACHCLEEEVAENGEEEEDDRWHHSLQPAFSSPSGEVAELYSCLVTAAGIAVRRVDRETGRLRPVKVITKKGGRRRGGFVKCQVLGASLGHLLVQHHEAVGRIGDGTGRDSCASSEDEEDHRSVIKVYSLKEEEEEEEGGPVAEYETNSGRGGNSPAVIVGERVFSLEGGDLSRGCDITSDRNIIDFFKIKNANISHAFTYYTRHRPCSRQASEDGLFPPIQGEGRGESHRALEEAIQEQGSALRTQAAGQQRPAGKPVFVEPF